MAVLGNLPKRTHSVGLGLEVHGQVRVVPLAQHAQAHEVGLLDLDLLRGILTAGLAKFCERHLLAGLAEFLLDIDLDRQAVAVPAGHIGCIESSQSPGLDDDVLERLVDRMSEVQLTIGIGGAVVKNETGPARTLFPDAGIQVHALPARQHFRFALRKTRLHGELCLRQVQGAFVVSHFVNLVDYMLCLLERACP